MRFEARMSHNMWPSSGFLVTAAGLGVGSGILVSFAASGNESALVLLAGIVISGGATSALFWVVEQLKGKAFSWLDTWAEMILMTSCIGPIVLLWLLAERDVPWGIGVVVVAAAEVIVVWFLLKTGTS